MVELFLGTLLPGDHLEVLAGMVRMAAGAALEAGLAVQAGSRLQRGGDLAVAGQALAVEPLLALGVALHAVEWTVQIAVGTGERPRGNLGHRRPRLPEDNHGQRQN